MTRWRAGARITLNRGPTTGLWVVLALVCTMIAGCTSERSPGGVSNPSVCTQVRGVAHTPPLGEHIAVIAAERRNSSPLVSLPQPLCDAISEGAKAQKPLTLIRLDGRPTVLGTTVFHTASKNPAARQRDINAYISATAQSITKVKAQQPNVDLRAALDLAAKQIHQGNAESAGTVYVLGSALQEVGSPNFASPGMIDAAPKEVADFLRGEKLLPDLLHINVIFVGFDATAAPQAALNTAQSSSVKDIWHEIVKSGGAEYIDFLPASATSALVPDADRLPPVNQVKLLPLPSWTPDQRYPDSGPLHFEPDTAVLTSPKAAREAMAKVPAWLSAHPSCSLRITGTTARVGDRAGQVNLAGARATTIKQIITSLGGAGGRISVAGLGSYFPGYVPDHDLHTGALIPNLAAQNRSVYFQPVC